MDVNLRAQLVCESFWISDGLDHSNETDGPCKTRESVHGQNTPDENCLHLRKLAKWSDLKRLCDIKPHQPASIIISPERLYPPASRKRRSTKQESLFVLVVEMMMLDG